MKRALLILAVALLIPGALSAQDPMMGVFFDEDYSAGTMHYAPAAGENFSGYLYLWNAEYYITVIEYQLQTPMDPGHDLIWMIGYEPNELMTLQIGTPFTGHTMGFWPPLNGFMPGYVLACTYNFYAVAGCGDLQDYPMVIGPHPDTGEIIGTYSPDNDVFHIIGLNSTICPFEVGVEEQSWGAIKSLYR